MSWEAWGGVAGGMGGSLSVVQFSPCWQAAGRRSVSYQPGDAPYHDENLDHRQFIVTGMCVESLYICGPLMRK